MKGHKIQIYVRNETLTNNLTELKEDPILNVQENELLHIQDNQYALILTEDADLLFLTSEEFARKNKLTNQKVILSDISPFVKKDKAMQFCIDFANELYLNNASEFKNIYSNFKSKFEKFTFFKKISSAIILSVFQLDMIMVDDVLENLFYNGAFSMFQNVVNRFIFRDYKVLQVLYTHINSAILKNPNLLDNRYDEYFLMSEFLSCFNAGIIDNIHIIEPPTAKNEKLLPLIYDMANDEQREFIIQGYTNSNFVYQMLKKRTSTAYWDMAEALLNWDTLEKLSAAQCVLLYNIMNKYKDDLIFCFEKLKVQLLDFFGRENYKKLEKASTYYKLLELITEQDFFELYLDYHNDQYIKDIHDKQFC